MSDKYIKHHNICHMQPSGLKGQWKSWVVGAKLMLHLSNEIE